MFPLVFLGQCFIFQLDVGSHLVGNRMIPLFRSMALTTKLTKMENEIPKNQALAMLIKIRSTSLAGAGPATSEEPYRFPDHSRIDPKREYTV